MTLDEKYVKLQAARNLVEDVMWALEAEGNRTVDEMLPLHRVCATLSRQMELVVLNPK